MKQLQHVRELFATCPCSIFRVYNRKSVPDATPEAWVTSISSLLVREECAVANVSLSLVPVTIGKITSIKIFMVGEKLCFDEIINQVF